MPTSVHSATKRTEDRFQRGQWRIPLNRSYKTTLRLATPQADACQTHFSQVDVPAIQPAYSTTATRGVVMLSCKQLTTPLRSARLARPNWAPAISTRRAPEDGLMTAMSSVCYSLAQYYSAIVRCGKSLPRIMLAADGCEAAPATQFRIASLSGIQGNKPTQALAPCNGLRICTANNEAVNT